VAKGAGVASERNAALLSAKKTNLRDLLHEKFMQIQDALNNRPLKCLGLKMPTEAYEEEPVRVALQT